MRLPEVAPHTKDAAPATSPAEPEAITTSLPSSQSTSQPLHRYVVDQQTALRHENNGNGANGNHASNASTPRLPPVQRKDNDLENMPSEDERTLDNPNSYKQQIQEKSVGLKAPSPSTMAATTSGLPQPLPKGVMSSPPYHALEYRSAQSDHSPISPFPSLPTDIATPNTMTPTPDTAASARVEAFGEKRNRSSSRSSQKRVEKSIEATLADEAPSHNARSRKSSHMFGLFKENIAEGKKASQAINSPPATVKVDQAPENVQGTFIPGEDRTERGTTGRGPHFRAKSSGSSQSVEVMDKSQVKENHQGPDRSKVEINEHAKARDITDESRQLQDKNKPSRPSAGRKRLPTRLLEEIRQHHNVDTPFHDKFRKSQGKPPPQNARPNQGAQGDRAVYETSSEAAIVSSRKGTIESEGDEEEDESDKEHISSALYFPHQVPSPDALQDVSIGEARNQKDER